MSWLRVSPPSASFRLLLLLGFSSCGKSTDAQNERPGCTSVEVRRLFEDAITLKTRSGQRVDMGYTIAVKEEGSRGEWALCHGAAKISALRSLPPDEYLFRTRWYDDQRSRIEVVIDAASNRGYEALRSLGSALE